MTGGAGSLGAALVALAPARGWDVRATWWTHKPQIRAEWVHADVRDAEAMERAVDGVSAVVHTAYRLGSDEWSTNVDGAETVAKAASGRRLIHLSTDVVFDGTLGRYREEDTPRPVNPYGRSKAEAELRVADAHPGATIARTSLIYGAARPGRRSGSPTRAARSSSTSSGRPCTSTTWRSALLELLDLERPGPVAPRRRRRRQRATTSPSCSAPTERCIERAQTTPDRAPDVTLDSSQAAALLTTRLRGVHEVLGGA